MEQHKFNLKVTVTYMKFLRLLLSFSYQFLFLKKIIILNLVPKKKNNNNLSSPSLHIALKSHIACRLQTCWQDKCIVLGYFLKTIKKCTDGFSDAHQPTLLLDIASVIRRKIQTSHVTIIIQTYFNQSIKKLV